MDIAKAFEVLGRNIVREAENPAEQEVGEAIAEIAKQAVYSLMSIAASLRAIAETQKGAD